MKKKVLVLGAVSCVAGIVMSSAAGCSSETTVTTPAEGGTDARPDRVIPEAGDDDAGQCPLEETLTAADLLAKPGYKPGKIQPSKCTTEEIAQFDKNLEDTNVKTWKDLETGLSADCAACIVTSTAADTWGPVVYTEESGGDRGFYNFGACFGAVEKDACGQAVQFLEFCLDAACDTCAETKADRDACIDKAADTGGMCAEFVKELQTQCKNLTTSGKKCNNIADAAKTLCGPPAGDGGLIDGGDAGDADAN